MSSICRKRIISAAAETGPSFTPFPGISCQATIVKSLRDNKLSAVREIDSTSRPKFDEDEYYELLIASFLYLRHDLQTEIQHCVGIADKIAAGGKNKVQMVVQFQTAADVEGEFGATVGGGGGIAEELNSKA